MKYSNDYWSLRFGDFLPETHKTLQSDYGSSSYLGYRNKETALNKLREAGNLFSTKGNALFAANAVRIFLSSLRQLLEGQSLSSDISPDNTPHPSCSAAPQTSLHPADENSQEKPREIHLTIHLHS